MTTAGYFNTGKKLEEGKRYPFKVFNLVTLQDERAYFILEDPYGIRHLLPSWLYTRYDIKPGQEISCIVDKINCTGRVYLEPDHPYYSKGCDYKFELNSVQVNDHRKKTRLITTDIFENKIEVDCPEELVLPITGSGQIVCTVVRVRKGRPVLVLAKKYKESLLMQPSSSEFIDRMAEK